MSPVLHKDSFSTNITHILIDTTSCRRNSLRDSQKWNTPSVDRYRRTNKHRQTWIAIFIIQCYHLPCIPWEASASVLINELKMAIKNRDNETFHVIVAFFWSKQLHTVTRHEKKNKHLVTLLKISNAFILIERIVILRFRTFSCNGTYYFDLLKAILQ